MPQANQIDRRKALALVAAAPAAITLAEPRPPPHHQTLLVCWRITVSLIALSAMRSTASKK